MPTKKFCVHLPTFDENYWYTLQELRHRINDAEFMGQPPGTVKYARYSLARDGPVAWIFELEFEEVGVVPDVIIGPDVGMGNLYHSADFSKLRPELFEPGNL